MRRKFFLLATLTLMVCIFSYDLCVVKEQKALAGEMIRLHVVANSDTDQDQWVKLQVRDTICATVDELTANCATKGQAMETLQARLPALTANAQRTLASLGQEASVRITLGAEEFPRRDYDTFSLPAGNYDTLRVVIGQGGGHNWWCVAFPSLCLPATTEGVSQAAVAAGLSQQEQELMTEESEMVEIKFRTLEWLHKLKNWITTR